MEYWLILRHGLILLTLSLLLTACGGGGGGGGAASPTSTTSTNAPNQVPVTVAQNPAVNTFQTINLPYVTITVCDNFAHCQLIDHVILDTGSYGLRILASAMGSLSLPAITMANATLAECATFLGGYMWGGVHAATLQIAGETAPNIPIEVVGDPAFPVAPAGCQSTGNTNIGTLTGIGGNGILGVGAFVEDQGDYYACNAGTCNPAGPVALSSQVSNPVAFFTTDNNGIIVQMPSVPMMGQFIATGTLTFGIDTQPNNSIAGFQLLPADDKGNFSANITGQVFNQSFIDSGSDYYFIPLSGLNLNGYGDHAPASYTTYDTSLYSAVSPVSTPIHTQIAIINSILLNFGTYTAFDDIADPGISNAADFGMPFFYGKSLAFVISGRKVTEGVGPLYALH